MLSQTLGVKTAAKKITAVANSELQIKYKKRLDVIFGSFLILRPYTLPHNDAEVYRVSFLVPSPSENIRPRFELR